MEAQVALSTLLQRIPSFRLAAEPAGLRWRPGLVLRGLMALPVTLAGADMGEGVRPAGVTA